MSVERFAPKRFDQPLNDILDTESIRPSLESARRECSEIIDQLTADVSGIGPKAAERYLLRFEYGFETTELLDYYDISKSTLSKQTNQVHRRVLKYPILARVVGQLRSDRTDLTRPDASDKILWDDELDLYSHPVNTTVRYVPGDVTTTYSWRVDLWADFPVGENVRRLRCNYLIDEEYGVLLKRILKGISSPNTDRTFHYDRLRTYRIFPLPHSKCLTADSTLLDGLEYHVSYDIKRAFEKSDWKSLEETIAFPERGKPFFRPRPELALPETITGNQATREQITRYEAEVHRRDNLEHLLRAYPYTRIENIPYETVDLLWNGPLHQDQDYLQTILKTSTPQYHPGLNRTLWSLHNE